MKRKPRIPWIIVALYVLFIFSNSLLNGDLSAKESGMISRFLLSLLARLDIYISYGTFHFFVRKAAHFSEYMVLGWLVRYACDKQPLALSRNKTLLLFMVATPILDESLQRFTPGRAGMFTDCLIDMSGFLFGQLLVSLLAFGRRAIASRHRS